MDEVARADEEEAADNDSQKNLHFPNGVVILGTKKYKIGTSLISISVCHLIQYFIEKNRKL